MVDGVVIIPERGEPLDPAAKPLGGFSRPCCCEPEALEIIG
jgi:hypothetical protein